MEVAVHQVPPSEKRLADALQHRFYLRVHMAAMLTATLLAGLIVTRLLLAAGVRNFAVRYGIAVVVAYAVFITSVKLWLAYIGFCAAAARRRAGSTGDDWFDCLNMGSGGSSSWSGGSSSSSVSEGGGKFGGGGASGSWGDGAAKSNVIAAAAVPPQSSAKKSSSSSSSSKKSGGGGDFGELVLVLLIILLVVAVIASFAWMIWAAPTILSEVAFNAVLAGALAKHAQTATHGNWVGSVMKKTMIPFLLILTLAILVGYWAQKVCPVALRLTEAVHCAHPVF
ncbi:MAG TPA: hypothetical protein VF505_03775 [Thermoanaerobaculia bacterium]